MSPTCKTLILMVVLALAFAMTGRFADGLRANGEGASLNLCPFCHQEVRP